MNKLLDNLRKSNNDILRCGSKMEISKVCKEEKNAIINFFTDGTLISQSKFSVPWIFPTIHWMSRHVISK